jgi:hypothetical protein
VARVASQLNIGLTFEFEASPTSLDKLGFELRGTETFELGYQIDTSKMTCCAPIVSPDASLYGPVKLPSPINLFGTSVPIELTVSGRIEATFSATGDLLPTFKSKFGYKRSATVAIGCSYTRGNGARCSYDAGGFSDNTASNVVNDFTDVVSRADATKMDLRLAFKPKLRLCAGNAVGIEIEPRMYVGSELDFAQPTCKPTYKVYWGADVSGAVGPVKTLNLKSLSGGAVGAGAQAASAGASAAADAANLAHDVFGWIPGFGSVTGLAAGAITTTAEAANNGVTLLDVTPVGSIEVLSKRPASFLGSRVDGCLSVGIPPLPPPLRSAPLLPASPRLASAPHHRPSAPHRAAQLRHRSARVPFPSPPLELAIHSRQRFG